MQDLPTPRASPHHAPIQPCHSGIPHYLLRPVERTVEALWRRTGNAPPSSQCLFTSDQINSHGSEILLGGCACPVRRIITFFVQILSSSQVFVSQALVVTHAFVGTLQLSALGSRPARTCTSQAAIINRRGTGR